MTPMNGTIRRTVYVPWGEKTLREIHDAIAKLGLVVIDTEVVAILDDGTLESWWLAPAERSAPLRAA